MVAPAYTARRAANVATTAPVEAFPTTSPLQPFRGPKLLPGSRPAPDIPQFPASAGTSNPSQVPQAPTVAPIPQQKVLDPHHYANVLDSNFPVPASTATSSKVVDAAPNFRNFLMIRNTDAVSNVLVSFGRQATAQTTLSLSPGQQVLFDSVVPQGDIYVLSSGAAASVSIAYGNT